MAAFTKFSAYRYIGLSTDTKPTGVELIAFCYETDTKKFFATSDGSTWAESDIAKYGWGGRGGDAGINLTLTGTLTMPNIPTSDPHVAGEQYVDESGLVRVSAG